MRGGTSKGVFFALSDLPKQAQLPGSARDAMLLRVIGSPDPYGKHTDGMGGATSSTSKTVILSKSDRAGHDVNYLFGQVAIHKPHIDWSGNCGNLTAAVGAFAIENGLVDLHSLPNNGIAKVVIWQENIQKTIVAYVPMYDGQVQEMGDFELDGVTFPAAEVKIEFIQPVDSNDALFPTGNVVDTLQVPEFGQFQATFINAGIPTIFLLASELGYDGTELQEAINSDNEALAKFETLRAYGAKQMGLIDSVEQAKTRQHTPKVAFIAPPTDYISASGKHVKGVEIDLSVRALSMGKLHHAMMGTAAVAIASAAAVEGTLVNTIAGGGKRSNIHFGHPSGTLKVGASVKTIDASWQVEKVAMSRSARILMEGWVRVPQTST